MSMKKDRQIYINIEEKITLQTMIAMEIRSNEECNKQGIVPCFETNDLIKLYKKVAGYEYEERKW